MGGEPSPNLIKPLLCIIFSLFFLIVPAQAATAPFLSSVITPQEHALNAWLYALGSHENCPPGGLIDSNGLRSYGRFCFQLLTFQRYSKKYGINDTASQVADYDIQRELVLLIIQEPYGYDNWRNTVKVIGKPPTVSTQSS